MLGVRKCSGALASIFGVDFVAVESPIDVSAEDNPRNEPEPDVVVSRTPYNSLGRHPVPADILMLVEVADSTLRQDLKIKARLYARAHIPEYWVLDVQNDRLHVLRDPEGDSYQTRLELGADDTIAPLERPESTIAVSNLLR